MLYEVITQQGREVFAGMIENSRRTHREALFEHVLNYLILKHDIKVKAGAGVREMLEQYYGEGQGLVAG